MSTAGQLRSTAFTSAGVEAARVYDGIMVPRLFRPWAGLLLDQVGVRAGDALLDVACGTGAVTRRAAARIGPSGRVTGCDVSPVMLAVARSTPAQDASAAIEYLECPAHDLTVPAGAYDVVTCQQGMQFFGERELALREMRRALHPGGRLGIAAWSAIEESPPFASLAAALDRVLGARIAAAYRSGPWALASADLSALAAQAGFTDVRASRHRLPAVFDGGPAQLLRTLATSAVAADVAALGDAGQRALLAALEEEVAPLMAGGAVRSQTTAQLVIACSP
jgi:ubiquinone/menaquinone biosynthesis C-methylase UbiE